MKIDQIPKVIIGANFGDEGKGKMVDALASKIDNCIIVRFNGSCQAAHTVHDPITKRYYQFGHFGSGSILGKPTYLSKFFIVNPVVLINEVKKYKSIFNNCPEIFIHPDCLITTPWDILINQDYENFLGKSRHGSCGLGINETITRSENFVELRMKDLVDSSKVSSFIQKLKKIRDEWVPLRCKQLGINIPSLTNNKTVFNNFIVDCYEIILDYKLKDTSYIKQYDNIIFEGAQGLLLDEDSSFFPHVTRSKTGIKNVIDICMECGIHEADIIYVTRCYLTRHGAGPLPFECEKPFQNILDDNAPNEFQGSFRFAPLNFDLLIPTIYNDFNQNKGRMKLNLNMAVTCVDQIEKDAQIPIVLENNIKKLFNQFELIRYIQSLIPSNKLYLSFGKSRETLAELKGE